MIVKIFVIMLVFSLVESFRYSNNGVSISMPHSLSGRTNSARLNMIFGKPSTASKSSKIVVKVDGKVIETDQKSVNLRRLLIDNNVDVYPFKAKVLGNCGGAGICGTCAVKVIDGMQNFNPPSKNELKTLDGKPSDIRLSCCSKISGPVTIKTKP